MKQHLTVRLKPETLAALEKHAKRLGQNKSALVERLIDEGIRMDKHPYIHFVRRPEGDSSPRIKGHRLPLWLVIEQVKDFGGDIEEAARWYKIGRHLIDDAVAYYAEYKDEIDAEIAENNRIFDEGLAEQERRKKALVG